MNYVVGFMFSDGLLEVCLMRKNRPTWQMGRLNGIGGKIEADECAKACMIREFYEETGAVTSPGDWHEVATLKIPDSASNSVIHSLHVFAGSNRAVFESATTKTDEPVLKIPVGMIPTYEVVLNVPQLVVISLQTLRRYRNIKNQQ